MLDLNTPYPIWDLTSSGLTEVWPVLPPNALRVGDALRENNFGLIDIDWSKRELNYAGLRCEGRSADQPARAAGYAEAWCERRRARPRPSRRSH